MEKCAEIDDLVRNIFLPLYFVLSGRGGGREGGREGGKEKRKFLHTSLI